MSGSPLFPLVVTLLVLCNLAGIWLMRLDKGRAGGGGRRIPERTLLGVAALGGSVGVLTGIYTRGLLGRHKSRKLGFKSAAWGILLGQILLGVWLSGLS